MCPRVPIGHNGPVADDAKSKKHLFKPGQSGNPSGKPKGFAGLSKMIAAETGGGRRLVTFALQVLEGVEPGMRKESSRMQAHKWLAEWCFGKVPDVLVTSDATPQTPQLDFSKLTVDEILMLRELHQRALPSAPAADATIDVTPQPDDGDPADGS